MELEDLERAAGLDPDSPQYRLRKALAEADDNLLEDLVRLRKAKGLTQQQVADRMHRDKAAVSNFERLSADPHLSTIRRYAAAVGARVSHQVTDFDLIQSSDYTTVIAQHWEKLRDAVSSSDADYCAENIWGTEQLAAVNVIPIASHRFKRHVRRNNIKLVNVASELHG